MSGSGDLRIEAERLKSSISLQTMVSARVKLKRSGNGFVGLCPFHEDHSPSFSVKGERFRCFACDAKGDIFDWCRTIYGLSFPKTIAFLGGGNPVPTTALHQPTKTKSEKREPENGELASMIWIEAIPAAGTLVETYLRSRGLELPSGICAPDDPVLRFHPRCPAGQDRLPAMVALMTDPVTGDPVGVHRTFLAPDGKAKAAITRPKMMLGGAGVIRLYEAQGDGLGLAESVETGLAVAERFQWQPVWAAGSSVGIKNFPVLPGVTLTVFADNDDSGVGLVAAREAATRYVNAGHESHVMRPPSGRDWLDAAEALT